MLTARSIATGTSDGALIDLPSPLLDEFIEFLYGGAFTFAVSREAT
jgi:hypothetical protein